MQEGSVFGSLKVSVLEGSVKMRVKALEFDSRSRCAVIDSESVVGG